MRHAIAATCLLAAIVSSGPARADDCPGNPHAIGTSRTIAVDPEEHPFLGALQYRESLPLEENEVVLTFDDGPLPPYTSRVLETLASECVKATFFMVGRMARVYPQLVKRVHAEGHTLANHSENHPFTFHKMTVPQAAQEIEQGLASIKSALGDPDGVSHFFRVPGLLRQEPIEQYLVSRGYMTWSIDFLADDWTKISDKEIVRRALKRIEARGRGILLLHDIQPATALALPELLHELKARGYRIVHVVEAGSGRTKTATLPEQWIVRGEKGGTWPHVQTASRTMPEAVLNAPSPRNFGVSENTGEYAVAHIEPLREELRGSDRNVPLPDGVWPEPTDVTEVSDNAVLAIPAAVNFQYRVGRQRNRPVQAQARPVRGKHKDGELVTASVPAAAPKSPVPPTHTAAAKPAAPAIHQMRVSARPETAPKRSASAPAPQAASDSLGILKPAVDFVSKLWR